MDENEVLEWVGAAVLIAAFFFFPKWFSFRQRAIAGAVLFTLGWMGIFAGLSLGDQPFMQSEAVAFGWVGISALAIVIAITLLLPLLYEWRRRRR